MLFLVFLTVMTVPVYAANNTTTDCSTCYSTVDNLTAQIQLLQNNVTNTLVSLATVTTQYQHCSGDLQSYKDRYEECRMTLADLSSNLSKCQAKLDSTQTEKNMVTGQLSSTKSDLSTCKSESQHKYPISVVIGALVAGAGVMYYYNERERKFGIRSERDGRQIGIRKIG